MTSVYEICQKSYVGYALTCHSLRMHFCLFSLLFKGLFSKSLVNFPKMRISNFFKNSNLPKIQNVLLLFRYCHDADHMYNENSLKRSFSLVINFSPKLQFYTFCPQNFALSSTSLNLLQSRRFDIGINQK